MTKDLKGKLVTIKNCWNDQDLFKAIGNLTDKEVETHLDEIAVAISVASYQISGRHKT